MKNYLELVKRIIDHGDRREDRTGVGTLSVFGGHLAFDLRDRFPLVTAKETRWKTAFLEMLWFLRGENNTHWLNQQGCKLWDAWAEDGGHLGPVYGSQWRNWDYRDVDQVRNLIEGIKTNPMGRRHIVSAWNVHELDNMALPPCHAWHQAYASENGQWLDLQVYQRSWDMALGAPFNIAQYALLLHLYARATGRRPRRLHFAFGDAHIYLNHVEAMCGVLAAGEVFGDGAQLVINTENTDIDGYKMQDFGIRNYWPRPFVKLEVAV
jgi:thymidylate synthase